MMLFWTERCKTRLRKMRLAEVTLIAVPRVSVLLISSIDAFCNSYGKEMGAGGVCEHGKGSRVQPPALLNFQRPPLCSDLCVGFARTLLCTHSSLHLRTMTSGKGIFMEIKCSPAFHSDSLLLFCSFNTNFYSASFVFGDCQPLDLP